MSWVESFKNHYLIAGFGLVALGFVAGFSVSPYVMTASKQHIGIEEHEIELERATRKLTSELEECKKTNPYRDSSKYVSRVVFDVLSSRYDRLDRYIKEREFQVEDIEFEPTKVLGRWVEAINLRDYLTLADCYADTVKYYKEVMPGSVCAYDKQKRLEKDQKYRIRACNPIRIDTLDNLEYIVYYEKEEVNGKGNKFYNCGIAISKGRISSEFDWNRYKQKK